MKASGYCWNAWPRSMPRTRTMDLSLGFQLCSSSLPCPCQKSDSAWGSHSTTDLEIWQHLCKFSFQISSTGNLNCQRRSTSLSLFDHKSQTTDIDNRHIVRSGRSSPASAAASASIFETGWDFGRRGRSCRLGAEYTRDDIVGDGCADMASLQ